MDRERESRRAGWRLIGGALRSQTRWVVGGVASGVVWTAAKITIPLLAAAAIDQGILPGDTEAIVMYAVLIVLVGVGAGVRHGRAALRGVPHLVPGRDRPPPAALRPPPAAALRVPRPGADRSADGARQHRHPAGQPGRGPAAALRRVAVHRRRGHRRDDVEERHPRVARARRVAAAQRRGDPLLAPHRPDLAEAPGGARRPVGRRRGDGRGRPRREGLRVGAPAGRAPRSRGRRRARSGAQGGVAARRVPPAHRLPARRSRSSRSSGTAGTSSSTATSSSAISSRSTRSSSC